jgi:hypothetical protein
MGGLVAPGSGTGEHAHIVGVQVHDEIGLEHGGEGEVAQGFLVLAEELVRTIGPEGSAT